MDDFLTTLHNSLSPFEPSDHPLFEWLKNNLTTKNLREIANSDDGYMQDECFTVLTDFMGQGIVPPDKTPPLEMLILTQCSEPNDPELPEEMRYNAHIERLFACYLLLRVGVDNPKGLYAEQERLICMVESALYIDSSIPDAVLRFTCWYIDKLYCSGAIKFITELPLLVLGVIILTLTTQSASKCEETLPNLIQLLHWLDQAVAESSSMEVDNWPWILRHSSGNIKKDLWQYIAKKSLNNPPFGLSLPLKQSLLEISNLLTQDTFST
jgi:hypothetical protein